MARGFMANLSTPAFLVDQQGVLVFYNEAAEEILGLTFAEAGPMPAEEWGAQFFEPTGPDPAHSRCGLAGSGSRCSRGGRRTRRAEDHVGCRASRAIPGYGLSRDRPWRTDRSTRDLLEEAGVMHVRIWGTRGSLPTPGSEHGAPRGNPPGPSDPVGRSQDLVLGLGTGIRNLPTDLGRSGERRFPHPALPSSPRPHSRPAVLRAVVSARRRSHPLGTRGGCLSRAAHRALPLGAVDAGGDP